MKWMALVAIVSMIALALYVVWTIGGMPGRIAAERNHPQAEAINVGGWATLFFGMIGWPWILMWAYSHPALKAAIEGNRGVADDSTGESE